MLEVLVSICLMATGGRAETKQYEPTDHYVVHEIEGWRVYVHRDLLGPKKDLGEKAIKLLRMCLYQVTLVVPRNALVKLREVPIWLEAGNPKVRGACYHPSRQWLIDHGFNPEKARSIEIGNPKNFLDWWHHQPMMVLHELAHAYHHQVLGNDNEDIRKAYKRAVGSKKYDNVLHWNGRRGRAYAMNNDKEYFAETSEAFFGTNDIYPFIRIELREHDPEMYELLKRIWGR